MSVLLDTNILVRSAQPLEPGFQLVSRALESLRAKPIRLFIVPQNLYEFWVVATRPRQVNGLDKSAEEALLDINDMLDAFELLDDTSAVWREWLRLVSQHDIKGKSAHDARLVASMRVHGISTLLTFNAPDFQRFSQIQVLHPELAAEATSD